MRDLLHEGVLLLEAALLLLRLGDHLEIKRRQLMSREGLLLLQSLLLFSYLPVVSVIEVRRVFVELLCDLLHFP